MNDERSEQTFEKTEERVELSKLSLLVQQNPLNFVTSNLVAPLLIAIALGPTNESFVNILAWTAFGIILCATRALHHREFANFSRYAKSARQWEFELVLLSLVSGLFWSAALILFVDVDQPILSIIVITAVFALISASVAGLSTHPNIFNAFVFALWIPALVYFLSAQGLFYIQITILGTFFVAVNVSFAVNQGRAITQSLRLRYENLKLLAELRDQKVIAEEANSAKSRFLAAASHDLRQPLHAMSLFADSLFQRIDSSENKRILSQLTASMDSLKSLFNSLLDISRLDAGVIKPDYSLINLGQLLQQLVDEYEQQILARGLQIRARIFDAWVYSDPALVEQIFRNLIWNAIKYTEAGGILVAMRRRKGKKIFVEIWDTGIGVSETEQNRIFNEFHQINNAERNRSQGIGLGLSIVQRTAALSDLKLGLKSRFHMGSMFYIGFTQLPTPQTTDSIKEEDRSLLDSDLKNVAVLLVDDDPDIRESLGMRLKDWGCRIHVADSLSEAEEILDDFSPDILLTDFQIKNNETGDMIIKKVRDKAGFDIPSIIITGNIIAEKTIIDEIEEVEILYKPVQSRELKSRMIQALNR